MRKYNGSAFILVIAVFIFVSLFSALMISTVNQSIYQTHTYGMQTQCYYMNNEAANATVAVMLANDNDLLKKVSGPQSATMIHTDEDGNPVGTSVITVQKENHNYYGENQPWVVGRITTTITDKRAERQGEPFTYEGTVMILIDNPLIQLFNLNPEDF